MLYPDYLSQLEQNARDFVVERYGVVHENGRDYPLLRLTLEGPRELVITSGFHGEEPAGPLTLMQHVRDIAAEARELRVGLRIYPCINPSGFEAGHRYNASGEKPNNDFLRYRLKDGREVGELTEELLPLYESHRVQEGGPKETRAIVRELESRPAPHAALDIHQDNYIPRVLTYAYTFGPKSAYAKVMAEGGRHAEVASWYQVDENSRTDEHGLIEFHDGSITDYYWRRGVPFVAALETTTRTPMEKCDAINRLWISAFLRLAAGR